MSYDMSFDCGPIEHHNIKGGTYAVGGTTDPWFNITYNYSPFFYKLWPEKGIRSLYGLMASDVVQELDAKIPLLSGEPDDNYWSPTEGNAKAALIGLRALAAACPSDSILNGD